MFHNNLNIHHDCDWPVAADKFNWDIWSRHSLKVAVN